MKRLIGKALLLVVLLLSSGTAYTVFAHANSKSPLKPVPSVDTNRYAGRWYEFALIPYFFQNDCATNALVEYSLLEQGIYRDYFECDKKNGEKKVLIGRAKSVRPENNVLSATFLNFFGWRYWLGDNYWILGLEEQKPDYGYAIVGEPGRKLGWVLSRTPTLEAGQVAAITATLKQNGYDPCAFMLSPQSQGQQEKVSLCSLTEEVAGQK